MIRTHFSRAMRGSALSLAVLGGMALQAAHAQAQGAPEAAPSVPAAAPAPSAAAPAPVTDPTASAPQAVPEAPAEAPAVTTTVEAPAPTASVEPAPLAAPVATEPAPEAKPAEEPHARLDYSDGTFYLRSANDNIVFVPAARAHIDTYGFAGPGVSDYHRGNGTGLKTNMFFRRFIIEMGGIIRGKWFYWLGGNFAPTTVDGNQNPISSANVYDGFAGYLPTPRIRIYLGQYNAPFTMENVTSSRWLDLMERSLTVRTLGAPYNKADGLMVWGETEHKHFEYQLGAFGGDGMNRQNVDNNLDGMARLVARPLASRSDALKGLHVGVGARLGTRDKKFVQYDAPSMSTPGGYAYWSPSYKAADGTKVHVVSAGTQLALSAEAYVPFERFDVRGEVVYLDEDRREVSEADKTKSLRSGTLSGLGGYGQLSVWLLGTPRINGNPAGVYGVTKLPNGLGTQAPYALQLVLRGEMIRAHYDANTRGGIDAGKLSANTNNISVNAYNLGLNYWATKHVRLTAEYSLYQFLGSPSTNQAVAPGVASTKSPNANTLSEISFRVGLAI